jgi:hypothetical protein
MPGGYTGPPVTTTPLPGAPPTTTGPSPLPDTYQQLPGSFELDWWNPSVGLDKRENVPNDPQAYQKPIHLDWQKYIDSNIINEILPSTALDPTTRNEWARWLSRNAPGVEEFKPYASIDPTGENQGVVDATDPAHVADATGVNVGSNTVPVGGINVDLPADPNQQYFTPQDQRGRFDWILGKTDADPTTGMSPLAAHYNRLYSTARDEHYNSFKDVGDATNEAKPFLDPKYYTGMNWLNETLRTADLALGADIAGEGPTRKTKNYVAGHLDKLNKEHDQSFGANAPWKILSEDIINPITSDQKSSSLFGHARSLDPETTRKYGVAGYGQSTLM